MQIEPKPAIIHKGDASFSVTGVVSFDNVTPLSLEGVKLVKQCSQHRLEIDLEQVREQDASVLAMMIAWKRAAKSIGKQVLFINASEKMRKILTMFDLSVLLNSSDGLLEEME